MAAATYIVQFLLYTAAVGGLQYKTTADYLKELNYPVEKHKVVTEDGHILTLFRIPKKGATPVLLMHGLFASSDVWVLMEKDENLVNILSDNGYDIWLANQRGNAYSNKHVYLSSDPTSYEFWNFSIDEIGTKDIPATIDYILSNTGKERLFYVGHSMGCTSFLIYCSNLPQHCQKVNAAVFFGPFASEQQSISIPLAKTLVQNHRTITGLFKGIRIYEFLGRNQPVAELIYTSCTYGNVLCNTALQLMDFDKNKTLLWPIPDYVVGHVLGGTSINVFEHTMRIASEKGNFRTFNSDSMPKRVSNQPSDGNYRIENIKTPIALIWGIDDAVIDEQAINILNSRLKNVILKQAVPAPFMHLGCSFELKNNYEIVTNILNIFDKYDSS